MSYNVKRLVENGYLVQERSPHDRRMTRIRLSPKALELIGRIDELYRRNAADIGGRVATEEQLDNTNQVLQSLERYWSGLLSYG